MLNVLARTMVTAGLFLHVASCSCCPEHPSSSDPKASIVTVDTIPEFDKTAGIGLYAYFALQDVAFSVQADPGTWHEICVCGYGDKPGDVYVAYTYLGSSGSTEVSYRDKVVGEYTTTEYTYCWQLKVSPPTIAIIGSSTVDSATGIDWSIPSGVLISVPGIDDESDLNSYGPLYYYVD